MQTEYIIFANYARVNLELHRPFYAIYIVLKPDSPKITRTVKFIENRQSEKTARRK